MKRVTTAWMFGVVLGSAAVAQAGTVIDFETLGNGGTPVKGMEVGDAYLTSHGVRMRFSDGSQPIIAEVRQWGPAAFMGPMTDGVSVNNPVDAGAVGRFFIVDQDGVAETMPVPKPLDLVIELATPVDYLGASLLDVDQLESWHLSAWDIDGNKIGSINPHWLLSNDVGDGAVTPFVFEGIGPISKMMLEFTGPKEYGVGWGLDNLIIGRPIQDLPEGPSDQPIPVPLPPAALAGLALMGGMLGIRGLRRIRARS